MEFECNIAVVLSAMAVHGDCIDCHFSNVYNTTILFGRGVWLWLLCHHHHFFSVLVTRRRRNKAFAIINHCLTLCFLNGIWPQPKEIDFTKINPSELIEQNSNNNKSHYNHNNHNNNNKKKTHDEIRNIYRSILARHLSAVQ